MFKGRKALVSLFSPPCLPPPHDSLLDKTFDLSRAKKVPFSSGRLRRSQEEPREGSGVRVGQRR
jgi:hypothetical protein